MLKKIYRSFGKCCHICDASIMVYSLKKNPKFSSIDCHCAHCGNDCIHLIRRLIKSLHRTIMVQLCIDAIFDSGNEIFVCFEQE